MKATETTITGEINATTNDVISLFKKVTVIPGLSSNENQVADFIKNQLQHLDLHITEDDAGKLTGGNCGNLIVAPYHIDTTQPVTAFVAHMDTARDSSVTKIVHKNGRITSDGNSQLGADNRAGVALLLWYLQNIACSEVKANIICIFTVGEEKGMLGAKQLELSKWNVQHACVFDSSLDPGSFISNCAGMVLFESRFIGKAAHSAVSNGNGINAISMAAIAISSINKHPIPDEMSANIGMISGGEATNIVAPSCTIQGEVRGFDNQAIQDYLNKLEASCLKAADTTGGKCEWSTQTDFSSYTISEKLPFRKYIETAIQRIGLKPVGVKYTGGSDANTINEKGIPAINLGIGAKNPHADDEYIMEADFKKMEALIQELHHTNNSI